MNLNRNTFSSTIKNTVLDFDKNFKKSQTVFSTAMFFLKFVEIHVIIEVLEKLESDFYSSHEQQINLELSTAAFPNRERASYFKIDILKFKSRTKQ